MIGDWMAQVQWGKKVGHTSTLEESTCPGLHPLIYALSLLSLSFSLSLASPSHFPPAPLPPRLSHLLSLDVQKPLLEFDLMRTVRNGAIGGLFGPLVAAYYDFSDWILPPEIVVNRFLKILMDQVSHRMELRLSLLTF